MLIFLPGKNEKFTWKYIKASFSFNFVFANTTLHSQSRIRIRIRWKFPESDEKCLDPQPWCGSCFGVSCRALVEEFVWEIDCYMKSLLYGINLRPVLIMRSVRQSDIDIILALIQMVATKKLITRRRQKFGENPLAPVKKNPAFWNSSPMLSLQFLQNSVYLF